MKNLFNNLQYFKFLFKTFCSSWKLKKKTYKKYRRATGILNYLYTISKLLML